MNGCRNTLSYVGLWLALSALAAVTALMLQTSLLTFVTFIIENDALRPTYWGEHTLGPAYRASFVVIGGGLLMFVIWLERALRLGNQEGHMWRVAGRLTLLLGGVLAVSYAYVSLNA